MPHLITHRFHLNNRKLNEDKFHDFVILLTDAIQLNGNPTLDTQKENIKKRKWKS